MRLIGILSCCAMLTALAACDKPCPKGQQRYGVKCVDKLDAGTESAAASPDGSTNDSENGATDAGQDGTCVPSGALRYLDADGDGYGVGASRASCAETGFAAVAGDCDDNAAAVYPTAPERCNGRDDDCDDIVDESLGDSCDAAACTALGCDANAVCTLEGAKRSCKCAAGYEGNGKTCVNINDCEASPCKNGGTCADGVESYSCKCPSDFTGEDCELEICGPLLIRTRAEMDASRACAEVRGDLSIDPTGLSTLDETDLPHLRKVTGGVSIFPGLNSPVATPSIKFITVGALETIGGGLSLGPTKAKEVSFPLLRSVGADLDSTKMALSFMQMGTQTLTFPKLETIGGAVEFNSMQQLCSANFRKVSKVAGDFKASFLLKLPLAQIQSILSAASSTSFQACGCCIFQSGTSDCGTAYDPFSPYCQCTP